MVSLVVSSAARSHTKKGYKNNTRAKQLPIIRATLEWVIRGRENVSFNLGCSRLIARQSQTWSIPGDGLGPAYPSQHLVGLELPAGPCS